jgi:hypothetical protein
MHIIMLPHPPIHWQTIQPSGNVKSCICMNYQLMKVSRILTIGSGKVFFQGWILHFLKSLTLSVLHVPSGKPGASLIKPTLVIFLLNTLYLARASVQTGWSLVPQGGH